MLPNKEDIGGVSLTTFEELSTLSRAVWHTNISLTLNAEEMMPVEVLRGRFKLNSDAKEVPLSSVETGIARQLLNEMANDRYGDYFSSSMAKLMLDDLVGIVESRKPTAH